MIVLLYMLERGPEHWAGSVTSREAALFFHNYFMDKEYRRRIDFEMGLGKSFEGDRKPHQMRIVGIIEIHLNKRGARFASPFCLSSIVL
ncbi:hypothetical protein PAECIP111893_03877 [Paenibacillus plantiphilus]|uniref:Uncharacterized protein n=1 Tax=Paenibacillus plantiphilus TaxID=2905650 RepID=A0ABN8GU73_9BACL|nr:hypothetical protein PAECIP111893_03877 [Paenibacillus plantiphilus]